MANTKVPAHLSTGLALDDLSNVTPATGLSALGAAKDDLSNVTPATGLSALGAAKDDLSNVTPATGRSALGVYLPTGTVGLGFWDAITGAAANTAVPLPAGGNWAWFGFYLTAAGAMSGVCGGVDPGETEVLPAAADLIGSVVCWRVA